MKGSFSFTDFKHYLEGIAGGNRSATTSTAIVRDIQRFFTVVTPNGENFLNGSVFNLKQLELYYNHLKKEMKYKPTTAAEKLRRLCMAIGFIMHDNAENDQIYIRGSQVRDVIKRWIRSLSNSIAMQRQQHSMRVIHNLPNTSNAVTFLENPEVVDRVNECIKSLKRSFHLSDIKFLTAYAAAILLYGNCQRSGVIQNLTTEEFNQREHTSDGMCVISCLNHKTGPQGRAILVIPPSGESILMAYKVSIREHLIPVSGCEKLFFLTPSGTKYTQVYRKICEAVKMNGFDDIELPSPCEYRILMSTKAARHLDETTLRKVQKHLSHSEGTSRTYYEFILTEDATHAHKALKCLAKKQLK